DYYCAVGHTSGYIF
nr:immunoglobulin light chain junction region [Macaca mulatta]